MISELYAGLINNTCLLLTTGIIYFAFSFKDVKYTMPKKIFSGIIFGIIGIFIMSSPIELIDGVVFDTRSILISVVGMFFGFIPTIIAAIAMCAYRILLGGSGTIMGIMSIISTAGLGLLWNKFRLNNISNKKNSAWLEFYLFGIVTHIVMLLCAFALPREIALKVLQNIIAPVIIIYPIGTFLLCMIIFKQLLNSETNLKLKESEEKFQKTFLKNPAIMALTDLHTHKYINVNEAFVNKIGYSKEEILGKTADELGLFYNQNQYNEARKLLQANGRLSDFEVDVRAKDGRILTGLFSGELIITKNSTQLLTVMIDITEHKQAGEKLKESEAMLLESQKVAHIGSYMNDVVNGTWTCSAELEKIFGVDETYPHSLEGWINIVHPDWQTKLFDYVTKLYAEKTFFDMEYKIVRLNDGEERWVHGLGKLYFDENENTIRMIGTIQDITERKLKDEEIVYRSSHDVLTGLYNRRRFEEVLDFQEASGELPVSIIVGDVNSLKLINDAYGHNAGDIILKKIAEIIKEICGDNACSARRGGDEFAIILPKTTYEEACAKVMQIKKRCEEDSKDELVLTITFGVGTKKGKEQSLEKIQHLAEERMYTAKLLEGKNIRSTIVENLRIVLEEKTGETRNHCTRMSEMSQIIGEQMGFRSFEIANLKLLSLLHDIGKTGVPESILLKPGKLDEDEFSIMQKHCEIGYRIANTMPELIHIAEGILSHHERWDGKGYPQGLVGANIPIMSRIVAVLDTYDAMTNDRPYRKALSRQEAIEEITRCSGTQFDPEVVNVFLNKVLNDYIK